MDSGAEFSNCRKYRFSLWRIWDYSKPFVMFIGLNPSTANETEPDNTIKRVCAIAKYNGNGGIYMMNCFPLVSRHPEDLYYFTSTPYHNEEFYLNNEWLEKISKKCSDIVFAWGNFKVVVETGRD